VIEFFKTAGSLIMDPLYFVTSFIMTTFHELFTGLFGNSSAGQGWAWALSIVCLTIVIRILLIPLFVKQIKSSRNMQLLQPKVKELQKKYGHDRERLAQETMALYRETGTNPFASCLPLILQMPIFLALFRLIDRASNTDFTGEHFLTEPLGKSLRESTLFGAPVSDQFWGATDVNTQILAAVLVVVMTATTFLTQRQLMSKNMPADAMSGPYAQQQKMLLYVLPLAFGVGGVAFPIGVLLYWTTSNAWTMGQQFYVIHNNPAPGTPAAKAREERMRRKGKAPAGTSGGAAGAAGGSGGAAVAVDEKTQGGQRPPQRNQPKKQPRSKRKPGQR
jgi:YidC/Oxa1 family membrane protein insertase